MGWKKDEKKEKERKEFSSTIHTRRKDMKLAISVSRFSFFNLFFGYIVLPPTWCNWPMHHFSFLFYNFHCLCFALLSSKLSISYSSIYYCMLWNQYQKKQHIPINTKHIFLAQIAWKRALVLHLPLPFWFFQNASLLLLLPFCVIAS